MIEGDSSVHIGDHEIASEVRDGRKVGGDLALRVFHRRDLQQPIETVQRPVVSGISHGVEHEVLRHQVAATAFIVKIDQDPPV